MSVWRRLSRHSGGVFIASIGWLLNIPYWVSMYRYHGALGHSLLEHVYENLHLHLMVLGTIPIFMVLGYFWDKKSTLEREVSLRSDFLQAVLDNMRDGLVVYDTRRRIVEANKRVQDIFGASKGELLGKECIDLIKCDIEDCPVLTVFEKKKNVYGGVCEQLKRRGGRKAFVEINSYPIKSNGTVEYVLEVIKDVTEEVLKEKERILLSDIDEMLDSRMENKKILKKIADGLVDEFGYEAVCIAGVKRGGEKLSPFVVSVNKRIKALAGDRIKKLNTEEIDLPPGSPLDTVIKEGRILFSKNFPGLLYESRGDNRLRRLGKTLREINALKQVIVAPVKHQKRDIRGVIGLGGVDELKEPDALRLMRIAEKLSDIL